MLYVITGGPSAGKTTVIDELKKLGYLTESEKAKQVIDEWLAKGMTLEDIRSDEYRFQKEVLRLKIEAEQRLPKDKIVFLDRGILDTQAYYRLAYGNYDDKVFDEALKNCHYDKVFIFDLIKMNKDYFRIEDDTVAEKIDREIERSYKEAGMEIIRVPVMLVQDRVKYILDRL